MVVVKDITYSLTNAACLTLLLDSSQITHFLLRVSAWTAANISLLQELSLCVPLSLGFDSLPHRPHSGVEQGRLKGGTPKHGSFAFISFIFWGFSRDFARKKKSPAKLNV